MASYNFNHHSDQTDITIYHSMERLRYYIWREMIPVCPGEAVLETYKSVAFVIE